MPTRLSTADFIYRLDIHDAQQVILIKDLNKGGKSVTNDIEQVIADIAALERINPANYTIIYKAADGIWDGWDAKSRDFIFLGHKASLFVADVPEGGYKHLEDPHLTNRIMDTLNEAQLLNRSFSAQLEKQTKCLRAITKKLKQPAEITKAEISSILIEHLGSHEV